MDARAAAAICVLLVALLAGCTSPPETEGPSGSTASTSPAPGTTTGEESNDPSQNDTTTTDDKEVPAPVPAAMHTSTYEGPLAARIGFTVPGPCSVSLALSGRLTEGSPMFSALDLWYLPTMVVQHDGHSASVGPMDVVTEDPLEGRWYAMQTFAIPDSLFGEELYWIFGATDLAPGFTNHSIEMSATCGDDMHILGVNATRAFALYTIGELENGIRYESDEPPLQVGAAGTASFAPDSGSALLRLAVAERGGEADLLSLATNSDEGPQSWYHDGFSSNLVQATLAGPVDVTLSGTNSGDLPVVLFMMEDCAGVPWAAAWEGPGCGA